MGTPHAAGMARMARVVVVGFPHHVTQRGVRSMDVFFCDGDRTEYLSLMAEDGGGAAKTDDERQRL